MIFPSITTTNNNYFNQIIEAEKLNIKEICLFLTCLDFTKRQELYSVLKNSSFKKFPLIHLRHDLELWELDFLVNKIPSGVFNIHPLTEYSFPDYYQKYKDKIYIENAFSHPRNVLKLGNYVGVFAGICLDLTHLEDNRLNVKDAYLKNTKDLDTFKIGCAHVGPINRNPSYNQSLNVWEQESHKFTSLSEFDYLKNYPIKYYPEIIALEVENSIEEQLTAIKYLNQLLLP